MLKSPSVIVDLSIASQLNQFFLPIFEALFGSYTFRIVTSPRQVDPFVIIYY